MLYKNVNNLEELLRCMCRQCSSLQEDARSSPGIAAHRVGGDSENGGGGWRRQHPGSLSQQTPTTGKHKQINIPALPSHATPTNSVPSFIVPISSS